MSIPSSQTSSDGRTSPSQAPQVLSVEQILIPVLQTPTPLVESTPV